MRKFRQSMLGQKRPASVREFDLPHTSFTPSPVDWRNEVLYFLLPDRFSNGQETQDNLLNRKSMDACRPKSWSDWATSGGDRWQGGTIAGIASKLDYLAGLGVTTLWIGPMFKQRCHLNDYHGYAIQDFLEIDPRFGTRQELVQLVDAAHKKGIRVILDIIFNHSGHNWDYAGNLPSPPYRSFPGYYEKGPWLNADGNATSTINSDDEGVWPQELQSDNCYTRAGMGSLSGEDIDNDTAEMKRTDFAGNFRDFNFDGSDTLRDLARCYKYWIALTDIDGFRIDTLKHVPEGVARNFCGTIKEFAARIGKDNFFLVGEVGGPDGNAGRYLDLLELNLSATLDIGDTRPSLTAVAKGLAPAQTYFDLVQWDPTLGSHRNSGPRHVLILDDHDHISGTKVRFSSDASQEYQAIAGVAIQLFTLGVPCIYYGTEQGLCGPPKSEREQYLPDYPRAGGSTDKYLREIMFAANHPRLSGRGGLQPAGLDTNLPAFGAFGTVGRHCFDPNFPLYQRISALITIRNDYSVLRYGRQYLRDITNYNGDFKPSEAGDIISWSRILDEDEALCVVNSNGSYNRGGDVIVDATLNCANNATFQVIANSAQTSAGAAYQGTHPVGSKLLVKQRGNTLFVEIRDISPSEVLVLCNKPEPLQDVMEVDMSRPISCYVCDRKQ
jgi:glycosidase